MSGCCSEELADVPDPLWRVLIHKKAVWIVGSTIQTAFFEKGKSPAETDFFTEEILRSLFL